MNTALIYCFAGYMVLYSLSASAQQHADSTANLPGVEVLARPRPNILSPAQTIQLRRSEILNNFSVADAIRYFSGVQLKDYGGIGGLKTVNIRNMGTHHVGVFYDGIQLGNAQNGQIDLGRFSLDNMEEISLYSGQKTDALQTAREYASSSTIYLRSREPALKKVQKNRYRAVFKTGSFGLVNPALQWDQRLSDSVVSSLSTEFTHAHGRYHFRYRMLQENGTVAYDTTATRQNGDINSWRAEWGLYGRLARGNWRLKAYNYLSERGLPGFIASNLFKHGQRQWDHQFFLQGSYQKTLNNRFQLLLNGKYAYDYTRYLDKDTASMYTDNRYRQQELYLSLAQEIKLHANWKVALSTDYQYNRLHANLANFSYPLRHTAINVLSTSFTQAKWAAQVSLLHTYVHNKVEKNKAAPNAKLFKPTVFLSYRPFSSNDLVIRAFYKKMFRMPTFNDLYYTFIGNAVLEPEHTTQYNLGFTYFKNYPGKTLQYIEIRTDAYYNEVHNKIVAVPTSNPFRWMMLNLGLVRIKGVETLISGGLKLAANCNLSVKGNYTYQEARDFTSKSDSFYGDQIPYAPLHSFSITSQITMGQWQMQYSFLYNASRYAQKANIPRNYLPAWYTSDLGLSKRLTLAGCEVTVTAELNNLLNQYYDVVLNYPMPGRNFRATLSVHF